MVDFIMSERCRLSRILCVALVFPTPGACRAGPVIMRSMSFFYLRDKASCGGDAFPMSLCVCPNQAHLTTMQQLPVYLDSHEAAPPCSVSSQSNDGNRAGIAKCSLLLQQESHTFRSSLSVDNQVRLLQFVQLRSYSASLVSCEDLTTITGNRDTQAFSVLQRMHYSQCARDLVCGKRVEQASSMWDLGPVIVAYKCAARKNIASRQSHLCQYSKRSNKKLASKMC